MTSPAANFARVAANATSVPNPAGNYVHAVRAGSLLFLSGKGVGAVRGKVGESVSVQQAYDFARSTGIVLLAAASEELGSLSRVVRVVKMTGYVNATTDFTDHPRVTNGCSDLVVEIFGERGRHARTSVGVSSTPDQIPCEIELVLEVRESRT